MTKLQESASHDIKISGPYTEKPLMSLSIELEQNPSLKLMS